MTTRYEKLMKEMTPEKLIKYQASNRCSMCIYEPEDCEGEDCAEGRIAYLNQEIPLTKEQKLQKVINAFNGCYRTDCRQCHFGDNSNDCQNGDNGNDCQKNVAMLLQEVLSEMENKN